MNVFSKPTHLKGFSILEALVSIAILSIGISAFGKSYIYTVNTNTHIQDQLVSLHLGSEINNMVSLYALTLNDNNPNAFQRQLEQYASKLENDINSKQNSAGYHCEKSGAVNQPQLGTHPRRVRVATETVARAFQSSAFSCVSVQVSTQDTVPGVPNVWVNTRVSWVSRGLVDNAIQSVDATKLLVGKSIPAAYTKHWY